ncbi:MAG TPA: RNA polymerase sigma factor, partial [Caulobacteraceae bacterium]|nr:RNA polymerase sigma factor [Caulobacteraceae bacterium]
MRRSPRNVRLDYGEMVEAELAVHAKQADREAFRAITQRCNQRLFRIARAVVKDDDEAADVLQEAYLRAFAAMGRFRAESSLFTWLTQITLNEARGRLRKRRPTIGLEAVETAQEAGARISMFPRSFGEGTPESDVARAESRRLMEVAIDALPDDFRVVFMLRAVEECSVVETANQLGILPETVRTRLLRARQILRKALHAKLSSSVTEAFPFLGERCRGMTDAVLQRLVAG